MELAFNSGRFVSLDGDLNYREVLADFPRAKIIRILTYNISKRKRPDALLNALKGTTADVQLITNVPSRKDQYYPSAAGMQMRATARDNINIYISKLNPDNISESFTPFFNVRNHAKIIGTENIVYIGSANYSNESANSIETGVLIEDKEFIQQLYSEFFDKVKSESIPYYDEVFTAFELFAVSLRAKFTHHHRKMLSELYTDYERTHYVVADAIFIDINDLYSLYCDLDELDSFCDAADDTYDENNDEYNKALGILKGYFNVLNIDWMKEVISEGGSLYNLVDFNEEDETLRILENEYSSEAYDEHLNYYAEKAVNTAAEIYFSLHNAFSEEADEFLAEVERILFALDKAISFTDTWKSVKVNPEIDNT